MKTLKRIIPLLLVLVLTLSLLPLSAFAVGDEVIPAEEAELPQATPPDASERSPVPAETEQPDTTPLEDDPADDPSSGQDDLAVPPAPEAEADDEVFEPSPEPTVEPTPTAKPRTGRNILPDTIPGYNPLDPSNLYSYGEPVDNFYPPEFDLDDPNGIMPMSHGSIPDSM